MLQGLLVPTLDGRRCRWHASLQAHATRDCCGPATAAEKQMQADADYARQMQAKLDAAQARGGGRWGRHSLQHAAFQSLHRNMPCNFEATAAAGGTGSRLQAVTEALAWTHFACLVVIRLLFVAYCY